MLQRILFSIGLISFLPQLLYAEQSPLWFEESDLPLNPAIESGVLENGMRYILYPNNRPEQALSLRMRIASGSLDEPAPNMGLAHFLEHMAFRGSKAVPNGDMVAILERHGLSFGADTNAQTQLEQTVYQLDIPQVNEESLDTSLFLFREIASELTLDPVALEQEKQVILAEENQRNTAAYKSFIDWADYVFAGSDVVARMPMGTVAGIRAVNVESMRRYYQQNYRPERTTLIAVGSFDSTLLRDKIVEKFSDWTAGPAPQRQALKAFTKPPGVRVASYVQEGLETQLSMTVAVPYEPQQDSIARKRDFFIRNIANAALQYRLTTKVLASGGELSRPMVYDTDFFSLAYVNQASLFLPTDNWRDGVEVLATSINEALKFGFSEREVALQIASIRADLKEAVASDATRHNRSVAREIVFAVADGEVVISAEDALKLFEQHIANINAEEVSNSFAKQWQAAPISLYYKTAQGVKDINSQLLSLYKEVQQRPVHPYKAELATEFLYKDFGVPGKVVSDQQGAEQIRNLVFENGVRLNIKKTNFEEKSALISLRIGQGKLNMTAEQQGLDTLFDMGFALGGLQKHSYEQLRSILSDKNVSLSMGYGLDTVSGSYSVSPENILLQLQVLAAYVVDPGYRAEGEKNFYKRLASYFKSAESDPQALAFLHSPRLLAGGDVRFGMAPRASYEKLNFSQLQPLVKKMANEGPVEIAVVGDIDEDAVIKAVASTFGALSAQFQAPSSGLQAGPSFAKPQTVRLEHKGEKERAFVVLYLGTDDNHDAQQNAELNLLSEIIQLKVTKGVRENLGAAYSPGVFAEQSQLFTGFGMLGMYSTTTPDQVAAVVEVYKDIIAQVQSSGGITEDELIRARKPLVERLLQAQKSNWLWLSLASTAASNPQRISRFTHKIDLLQGVSLKMLRSRAQKVLDINGAIIFEVMPQ